MIRYFTSHPTAANLLMCGLLLLGLLTLHKIKREAMPDHSTRTLQISANYPGATAEEIEEAVAVPIEEALSNVNNIKRIKTTALESSVSIRVEMMDAADYQAFYNDVKREVEAVTAFPDQLEKLTIEPYNHLDQVVSLAVYGELSVTDLKAYCEDLKDQFMEIGNGIKVDVSGFSQHEFRIELSPSALHTYKLSVNEIADIISRQNVDLPAGTLETGKQDIKLRFSDRRKNVDELGQIRILSGSGGGELKLGDIARITDRFDADENKVLFNGKRAGVLTISKSKSADSLTIYDQVMRILNQEKAAAPPGLHFEITRNMASDIQDRLNMVYSNALQGFLLVFGALWLFLNIRLSIWVALGLPVSFLGGLFVMHCLGISLNMISTFALVIAIGLLMDDAIVISENIAVQLKNGTPPREAAINGVREVGGGVVSSFLTTICVFAPLVFLGGQIGKILGVIPLTLIIILSVSLIEAFFILPNHLAHSFKNGLPEPGCCRRKIDAAIDCIRFKLLRRWLETILPYRYLFLSLILALFIFSLGMFPAGYLKFKVFPSVDGDTVVCRVMLPPGTPLAESEAAAARICAAAEAMNRKLTPKQPGKKELVKFVSVNFSANSDYSDSGAHLFTVYADLLPGNNRSSTVAEVLNVWRQKTGTIPGVTSIRFDDLMSGPGGKPIEIRLHGKNLSELKLAASALQEKLASYKGVFDISDNLTSGKPELVMSLLPGAMKLGFTASAIAQQLRSAYQGAKADELQIGNDNYEFNVRLSDKLADNLHNFDNFQLTAPDGKKIPLLNAVKIREARGPSAINRYNAKRTVTVSAGLNETAANASDITGDLLKNYFPELQRRFPGVSCSFGGQREAGGETGSSMSTAFIIGIAGIFILLSLQFGKLLEPVVVMATIPLSIIGVIWGHIITGKTFDMQGLIGVISLAGIVVNDSILMIEFIKNGEAEGRSPHDAACQAVSLRFRALMLTSLTTVAGLLPILTEKSLQAQMLIPLALSIVCGLSTSTLLELFVIPALYLVIQDYRNRRRRGLA
ncbi:MAG: efflux RND transporter permease subunit [Victivallaceae bacterium]|nr:efflux RND transporter permease subunit [Victivallaceae bacterium]